MFDILVSGTLIRKPAQLVRAPQTLTRGTNLTSVPVNRRLQKLVYAVVALMLAARYYLPAPDRLVKPLREKPIRLHKEPCRLLKTDVINRLSSKCFLLAVSTL